MDELLFIKIKKGNCDQYWEFMIYCSTHPPRNNTFLNAVSASIGCHSSNSFVYNIDMQQMMSQHNIVMKMSAINILRKSTKEQTDNSST